MSNKKGAIYNTAHKSTNLKGYLKLSCEVAKAKSKEPLGGKICKRRYDCVHYAGMLSAGALYDIAKYYDCPKDCKAYRQN